MVRRAAPDLILRGIDARAMRVALVFEVAGMDPDDRAADVTPLFDTDACAAGVLAST